jgi:hypothetical protein
VNPGLTAPDRVCYAGGAGCERYSTSRFALASWTPSRSTAQVREGVVAC